MSYSTLAKNALEMISKVSVPASDENIAAVAQTRAMLHQIASGQLELVPAVKEKDSPSPEKAE